MCCPRMGTNKCNLRFYLTCLLFVSAFHFGFAAAPWGDELVSDNDNEFNITVTYDPATQKSIVTVREEITVASSSGKSLEILYSGDANAVITCDTDNSNYKCNVLHEDGKWYLEFTSTPDYETFDDQPPTVSVTLKDGTSQATFYAQLFNIDDNPPVVTPRQGNNCTIQENTQGIIDTCQYDVVDADGCVGNTMFRFYASDEITNVFRMDLGLSETPYPACLQTIPKAKSAIGKVSVLDNLDYESTMSYFLRFEYYSNGNFDLGQLSTILNVVDMPDELPKWSSLVPTVSVDEENATIFNIEAKDGDVQIHALICYDLQVLDDGIDPIEKAYFSVDRTSGVVSIGSIARDTYQRNIYNLVLFAMECDDEKSIINQTTIVQVRDSINKDLEFVINCDGDEKPHDSFLPQRFDENTVFSLTCQVTVTDPDEGDAGTFTASLDGSTAFTVLPTQAFKTGVFTIQSAKMFDYEDVAQREISFSLNVVEKKDPNHAISLPISVSINNVNDAAPVFQDMVQNALKFSIYENATIGEVLGVVQATDSDGGDIVYALVNTDEIIIDPQTGEIKINVDKLFDYERQKQVQYQVSATDTDVSATNTDEVHTTYAPLMITVLDINDTPPDITISLKSTSSLSVVEDAVVETEVTNVVIIVKDLDTNHSLTVDIDWSTSTASKDYQPVEIGMFEGWFKVELVNETSGEVVLKVAKGLDWAIADSLQLSIVATDQYTQQGEASQSAVLTLRVTDVNNNPPKFEDGMCDTLGDKFTMKEGSNVGLIVGTILATDADGPKNNVVTYSISNEESRIKVDINKGTITTGEGAKAVDYETEKSIAVVVFATDELLDEHRVNCNLLIAVEDVNDETPTGVADPESGVISIPEDTTDGTWVKIQGSDNDSTDAFRTIKFSMRGGQDLFELTDHGDNSAEIAVKLSNNMKFDYDSDVKSYQLSVILIDNPDDINNQLTSTTSITVNLLDVNDNAPVFTPLDSPDSCLFTVKEDAPPNFALTSTKIQAQDKDEGDNARVSYKIVGVECVANTNNICPDDKNELFRLTENEANGLTLADVIAPASLLGKFGKYSVNVTAEDHGKPVLSASQMYLFCIEDINDHKPVFEYPNNDTKSISVRFDTNGQLVDGVTGGSLPNFKVTDEDFGPNAQVGTWTIEPHEIFSLQPLVGRNEAILRVLVNSDSLLKTKVTLKACDSPTEGEPQCTDPIEIEIVPRQTTEVEPTFDVADYSVSFQENSTVENDIIPSATDLNNEGLEDGQPTEMVYYYIISCEPEEGMNQFSLNASSGELSVLTKLDASEHDQYNLTVQTSNLPASRLPSPAAQSLLRINVSVEDINDKAPEFKPSGEYLLSMTSSDADKVVLTVEARDPDRYDTVSYDLLKDTIEMNIDNSDGIDKLGVFSINRASGAIKVDKYPTAATSGYFSFNVTATDGNHTTTAKVVIYVISDQYLIPAVFQNTQSQVAAIINDFVKLLKEIYKNTCIPGQLISDDPFVKLPVYFLDSSSKPIKPADLAVALNDYNTSHVLQREVATRFQLDLVRFGDDIVSPDGTSDSVNTALIAVSAVLAALLVAWAAFYFVKTKRLNNLVNRLTNAASDNASDKKGLTLPNTNLHAHEGANPVWNTESVPDFDRVSTASSDDSGLIGIEDNPEFQSFYNQVVLKAKESEQANNNDMFRENPQLRGLALDDDVRY